MNATLEQVQLTFEHLGSVRVLNKSPRIQTAVTHGAMSVDDALLTPWFIRLKTKEGKYQLFKLAVKDADAIKQAKKYLDGEGTSEFEEFRKARDAKRSCTLGELAAEWQKLNMPDATQRPRDERAREGLEGFLQSALEFFKDITPATATKAVMNQFATWRRNRCKENKRGTGDRSIDMELGVLSCLCDWAASLEKIEKNPFASRPKYQRREDVSHCHEFMPESDEQWHDILRYFFTFTYDRKAKRPGKGEKLAIQDANYTLRLRIIGGWLAFTGLTGLRPEEPQFLYRFAELNEAPGNPSKLPPGTIFPTRSLDGQSGTRKMRVQRGKNGQNPFVSIHPALADFLQHWTAWLDSTLGVPKSSFARSLFPSPEDQSKSIFEDGDFTPLIRRLTDACEHIQAPRLKPKGFGRAFYVRVRRSQGIDDSVIAGELGQTTNGQLIRTTYGNPEDLAGGAMFDWLPKDNLVPAWKLLTLEPATNVIAAPNF